ncbi:glycosyltransferase [Bordetella bronchialis]|uniref:glycosyltransferase n=1 Tax=Bordetella bronchialis TaxID=463025 RepID=UPI003D015F0B
MSMPIEGNAPPPRRVLITCYNADPPTSGYATRVMQMVESYTTRGMQADVLRFIPVAHRAESWRRHLGLRGARYVHEYPAPPISRYEMGRRLAVPWCGTLARLVRQRLKPDLVQAEGHEAAAVTLWHGSKALQVVDFHGAVPEETEYRRRRHGAPTASAPNWFHRHEARALAVCDAYIVVSGRMNHHLVDKLGDDVRPERSFVLDVKSSSRFTATGCRVARHDYALDDDDIVVAYAGGTQDYQRLPDVARFVETLARYLPRLRLMVFTADPDAARRQLGTFAVRRTIVASVAPDDLYAHLRIADFGIIFRDDHVINRVASPTKVWEYLASGLHVICNRAAGNAQQEAGALDAALCVEPDSPTLSWRNTAMQIEHIVRRRRAAPDAVGVAARRHLMLTGGWEGRFDAWLRHLHALPAHPCRDPS